MYLLLEYRGILKYQSDGQLSHGRILGLGFGVCQKYPRPQPTREREREKGSFHDMPWNELDDVHGRTTLYSTAMMNEPLLGTATWYR